MQGLDEDRSKGAVGKVAEVFAAFLKLGLSSFGGPIAHLGYFRKELIESRGWLTESQFGQLLAICQFLPGPASSQLGFSIGLARAGWLGAFAASLALAFMFLPGFLLVAGVLPLWRSVSHNAAAARAIVGVNAAVVGMLGAALYDPIFTAAIQGAADMAIGVVAFALLTVWRQSALVAVLWCVAASILASL
jgi:chromate transporter